MISSDKPEALSDYPVVITLPIQWGDQDSFGHVNNVIPIRWCESARVAYMDKSGLGMMKPGDGVGPILASITCHYRRQLNYPDTVFIGARTTRIGRSSMTIEHAVYSQSLDEIAADAHSVIVVLDYGKGRPIRVPDDVRQAVEKLEGKSFDS